MEHFLFHKNINYFHFKFKPSFFSLVKEEKERYEVFCYQSVERVTSQLIKGPT